MQPLITLGVLQITPYSLLIFAGALIAAVLAILRFRESLPALLFTGLFALIGGHVFWCVFNDAMLEEGLWLGILKFWNGGYTLYGAVFGGLLGACIASRIFRLRLSSLLDALAPGAALLVLLGRVGEAFTGQGIGNLVEDEGLCFFPLATIVDQAEDYVDWAYAVWAWEAAIALVILVVLLVRARKSRPGEQAIVFLTALSATQILMEQFRNDDWVRMFENEFIRFSQIGAAATILGVLLFLLIRNRTRVFRFILSILTFAASAAYVTYSEFMFQKPQYAALFNIFALLSIALCAVLLLVSRKGNGMMPAGLVALLGAILLLLRIVGVWESENPLLYAHMALAVTIMGITVAANFRKDSAS